MIPNNTLLIENALQIIVISTIIFFAQCTIITQARPSEDTQARPSEDTQANPTQDVQTNPPENAQNYHLKDTHNPTNPLEAVHTAPSDGTRTNSSGSFETIPPGSILLAEKRDNLAIFDIVDMKTEHPYSANQTTIILNVKDTFRMKRSVVKKDNVNHVSQRNKRIESEVEEPEYEVKFQIINLLDKQRATFDEERSASTQMQRIEKPKNATSKTMKWNKLQKIRNYFRRKKNILIFIKHLFGGIIEFGL